MKKYFKRHFQFTELFQSEEEGNALTAPAKRQASRSFIFFVRVLRLLPLICLAGFITSFWIDFQTTDTLRLFGFTLNLDALLRVVSVSGLIGFSTNWIAIKMLFKPVFRRPIWGQGLIPAQKDRIVWQLAGGIHKHILSEELIQERIEKSGLVKKINSIIVRGTENLLHDVEFRKEVKAFVHQLLEENLEREEIRDRFSRAIDEKLEANLQSGLKGFMFRTYKTLNKSEYEVVLNNIIARVPDTVVEIMEEAESETETLIQMIKERENDLETLFSRLIKDVLQRMDIREILSKQMAHFDEAKLEQMIWNATNQQLLYIQYLGTLLGILGGLLIWQPEAILILYSGIFLILFGLDTLLHRIKQRKLGNDTH